MKLHLPEFEDIDFEFDLLSAADGEKYDLSDYPIYQMYKKTSYEMSYLDRAILSNSVREKVEMLTAILQDVHEVARDTAAELNEDKKTFNELYEPEETFSDLFENLVLGNAILQKIWGLGFEDEIFEINENNIVEDMFGFIAEIHLDEKEEVSDQKILAAMQSGEVSPIIVNVLKKLEIIE